jgi:hypothetical protein
MPMFEELTVQEIAQLKADCGYGNLNIFHDLRAYYGCSEVLAESIIASIKRE